MPLVSVITPVYNRELLVADSIRSIRDQTFQDWELIILDDASTDRTLEVCRSFAEQDKRIRVFTNEKNLGVGKTRNRSLSYVTGEYIAMQDSDDVSVPDRLEQQVDLLKNRPEIGLVGGMAEWVHESGQILGYEPAILNRGRQYPQDRKKLIQMIFLNCDVSNPTCMFRRSLNIPEPFGEYRVGEDWNFFMEVAHRSLIWGIPRVLVKMRRGDNHRHLWKDYTDGLEIIGKMRQDFYERYKDDPTSPVNYWLYCKGNSKWLTLTGRNRGGWTGYFHLIKAVLYDPSSQYSWDSLYEFSGRALKKANRLLFQK